MEPTKKRPLTNRDLEILLATPLFANLGDEDRRRTIGYIDAHIKQFAPNEVIVAAGTPFSAIGILSIGEATVVRSGEHRRVIHKTLSAGDIFGVSSLFDKQAEFPTTIKALCECNVIFLSERCIAELLKSVPGFAENYIRLLTAKIRFLNHRLDALAGRSAEERVADYLLSEIGADGALGVTKSALASMLGLGRASLYRILDLFEEGGFIRTSRDRIEILDGKALKTFIKNRKETQK